MDCDKDKCAVADDAADKAVKKVFAILGVNIEDPQQVEKFRSDLRFSSAFRAKIESGSSTVAKTLIVTTVVGLISVFLLGLKEKFGG